MKISPKAVSESYRHRDPEEGRHSKIFFPTSVFGVGIFHNEDFP